MMKSVEVWRNCDSWFYRYKSPLGLSIFQGLSFVFARQRARECLFFRLTIEVSEEIPEKIRAL